MSDTVSTVAARLRDLFSSVQAKLALAKAKIKEADTCIDTAEKVEKFIYTYDTAALDARATLHIELNAGATLTCSMTTPDVSQALAPIAALQRARAASLYCEAQDIFAAMLGSPPEFTE